MKFKLHIIIIFFVVLLTFSILAYLTQSPNTNVCINSHCFNLELAKTSSERQQGLMYRTSLKKDFGMLFIFPNEAKHSFWMKNTLIPLDIIWISSDNKITHIGKNIQPCQEDPCQSYAPEKKSKYVIEINANLSEEYGFSEGDDVEFKNSILQ